MKRERMIFKTTPLAGLFVVQPQRFVDNRGYFMETYNKAEFAPHVGNVEFVQDNESGSSLGVLRGLHMQKGDDAQAKLVRVVSGAVFDVAVDLRFGSDTFGQWFGTELSSGNGKMLYIPRGFAHGFVVLSKEAKFVYKVDNRYAPQSEITIAYDDPEIGIEWPEVQGGFILSQKDASHAISFRCFCEDAKYQ